MTPSPPEQRFTLVSFHAHPDDEALLTGGTLARAAAEGHRVVLVVATSGEAGLSSADWSGPALRARREAELHASAGALGAARVVLLGHPDSGWGDGRASGASFSALPVAELADELARILREEQADLLTVYDAGGGYGHPDHIQVHRVGHAAAALAGTPVVLEATVDRSLIDRAVRALRVVSRIVPLPDLPDLSGAYTARADLTHRVDVRRQLTAKRAALRAHASQGRGGARTVSLLLRLPRPLARLVLGHEWFREAGRRGGAALLDDPFASLREGGAPVR